MNCPNCGCELTDRYCPRCGADSSADDASSRKRRRRTGDAADLAAMQNDREREDELKFREEVEEELGTLPISRFLRKLCKSPWTFFCAVLATLYAGGAGFTCAVAGYDAARSLIVNDYASALSNEKIGHAIYLLSCLLQICMAIWLAVSLWSLFCSAVSRKNPTFHVGWFNSLHSFARAGQRLFFLMAACSAITVGMMLLEVDFSKPVFFSVAKLSSCAAAQTGLAELSALLPGEESVFRALPLMAVFFFDAIRFSMLAVLSTIAGGMLRFDEASSWKCPPIALMTFLSGALKLGVGSFLLLKKGTETENLMACLPLCVLGLTLILCSTLLHRYCAGVKRRQGA